jgi:hypothetical protein
LLQFFLKHLFSKYKFTYLCRPLKIIKALVTVILKFAGSWSGSSVG